MTTEPSDKRRDAALKRMLATPKKKRGAEAPRPVSQQEFQNGGDPKEDRANVDPDCNCGPSVTYG